MTFLIEFEGHSSEKALIGEMLMSYGEIEFCLVSLVMHLYGGDATRATRILFRVNGEAARLAVADAIMRPELAKIGLDGNWNNAYGAAKHCKNIRNQYAHCHWQNYPKTGLCFMNLDALASSRGESITVTFEPIDLPLIQSQHQYFDHTLAMLYYLASEYQVKVGALPSHDLAWPKSIPAPPMSNHPVLVSRKSGVEKT